MKKDKFLLIKFMEWQMETKPLIANFTHNHVANSFLEKFDPEKEYQKNILTNFCKFHCKDKDIKDKIDSYIERISQ